MIYSILFLTLLLILCSNSRYWGINGFSVPHSKSSPSTISSSSSLAHRAFITTRPKIEYQLQRLHAVNKSKKKGKEEADTGKLSNSDQVREMASFLAMQLLEVAMKEVTKDEKDTKITPEDIENLAKVLQGPMAETKKAQDKLETTWNAAGDAVEELLGDDGMTKLDAPTSSKKKQSSAELKESKTVINDDDEDDISSLFDDEPTTPKKKDLKEPETKKNKEVESMALPVKIEPSKQQQKDAAKEESADTTTTIH